MRHLLVTREAALRAYPSLVPMVTLCGKQGDADTYDKGQVTCLYCRFNPIFWNIDKELGK